MPLTAYAVRGIYIYIVKLTKNECANPSKKQKFKNVTICVD